MAKGFFFSMDALCAAIILTTFLFALLSTTDNSLSAMAQNAKQEEKMVLAAAVSESLVKSRNIENPLFGAASYSTLKRRVEANLIDSALLEKAGPTELDGYAVAGLYARKNSEREYYFKTAAKNCISVERLVRFSAEGHKAVIGVELCDK